MSITTLARNGDEIMYEDESKNRYFVNIRTGKNEKTNASPAAVITKYYFDEFELDIEFSDLEELIDFALSLEEHLEEHMKQEKIYKNNIHLVTEITCPYCSKSNTYYIDREQESLCCIDCFRFINVDCSVVKIIESKKNHAKYGFGDSRVYKFILSYFYKHYPEPVDTNEFMDNVVKVFKDRSALEDTINKMTGAEIEYTDKANKIAALTDKGIEVIKNLEF